MCLSSASRTASGVSTGRRSSRAPSITRFARRLSPISSAMEIAGTIVESTSARLGDRSTSEAFTTSVPPDRTSDSYLSSDGRFITITAAGLRTIGEPISSSLTMTTQCAVPPRISGPYDGNQVTCFPASSAAYARSCPAKSIPCPPKPERMISVCIASAPRHLLGDRRMHLVVAQREGGDHVRFHPLQRVFGGDPPVGGACGKQLHHREAQPLPLDLEGLPERLLRLADVGRVVQAPAHDVGRAVHLGEDFAHLEREAVHLNVPTQRRRGRLLPRKRRRRHLPARHAVDGVVDKDG